MVLAQIQAYRSIEQGRHPEIRHPLMVNYSSLKEAIIHNREKIVSSISGAGKTGQLHAKK